MGPDPKKLVDLVQTVFAYHFATLSGAAECGHSMQLVGLRYSQLCRLRTHEVHVC